MIRCGCFNHQQFHNSVIMCLDGKNVLYIFKKCMFGEPIPFTITRYCIINHLAIALWWKCSSPFPLCFFSIQGRLEVILC